MFAGVAMDRFFVYLDQRDGRDKKLSPIFIFDTTTQQFVRPAPGPADENVQHIAVAKDQPIFVASSGVGGELSVYRLDFNARNAPPATARFVKKLVGRGSEGTADVTLSDDGSVLYYTNSRSGTGGGIGARVSAAIDVQSERELW
jgi:hypothetical protein